MYPELLACWLRMFRPTYHELPIFDPSKFKLFFAELSLKADNIVELTYGRTSTRATQRGEEQIGELIVALVLYSPRRQSRRRLKEGVRMSADAANTSVCATSPVTISEQRVGSNPAQSGSVIG